MFLGIEIGGTKLQLGVGRGDGSPLVALERAQVVREHGAAAILADIERIGRSLIERYAVQRIGIGFGGPVKADQGRTTISHHVDGWQDFPLVEWCRQTFGLPAVLANDCDAAALAEACFGAGSGHRIVFFLTVGTGIGGGLVVDGRLFGTHRPAVAEIGHLRPWRGGAEALVSVESQASGTGIEERARRKLRQASDRSDAVDLLQRAGGRSEQLTARDVAEAAAEGNELAREVLAESIEVLGWAIAQAITLVAPEVVVVGGGVSLMGEQLFFDPLRKAVRRYVFHGLVDTYEIRPAQLGEQVVVHGALALAGKAANAD
ncbi:MAG: ROK family protein [Planctomycetes bacterium]|nr:ROK family protein [Planctomycetota bacterium]